MRKEDFVKETPRTNGKPIERNLFRNYALKSLERKELQTVFSVLELSMRKVCATAIFVLAGRII